MRTDVLAGLYQTETGKAALDSIAKIKHRRASTTMKTLSWRAGITGPEAVEVFRTLERGGYCEVRDGVDAYWRPEVDQRKLASIARRAQRSGVMPASPEIVNDSPADLSRPSYVGLRRALDALEASGIPPSSVRLSMY